MIGLLSSTSFSKYVTLTMHEIEWQNDKQVLKKKIIDKHKYKSLHNNYIQLSPQTHTRTHTHTCTHSHERTHIYIHAYIHARDIMDIVRNGCSNPSTNPGRSCLPFTLH